MFYVSILVFNRLPHNLSDFRKTNYEISFKFLNIFMHGKYVLNVYVKALRLKNYFLEYKLSICV